MYQPGLIRVFGKSFANPRALELRASINGVQQGIICGELRDKSASDPAGRAWRFFAADTTYETLLLAEQDKPSYSADELATINKILALCRK